MMSEVQLGAARVLEALDGEEDLTAYTVNLSNPVCPCCGAKLIIQDDVPKGQNEQLNTDAMIDEQYADSSVIVPMVQEVASEILDGWVEYCRDNRLDDMQIQNTLMYPRDSELREAIERKARELKSLFASSYGLLVDLDIIIEDLKECLKKMARQITRV